MTLPKILLTLCKIKQEKMKQGYVLPTKVIVREIEEKEEIKNGIILPNQVKKNATKKGLIRIVGSRCDTAQEGMIALYTPLSATRFTDPDSDEELALVAESSIIFFYRE
jgi:co-chaperonin GroES (HSP10)